MSVDLKLIARLLAYEQRRAMPIASHKRVALRRDAAVLAFLVMAGEDATIHGLTLGWIGKPGVFKCVPDPRRRDQQRQLLAWLGRALDRYVQTCRRAGSFPQIWVACEAAVQHLDLLAEEARYSDDPDVRRFGELMTYSTSRAPVAGQQTLVTATGALREHWATGQQSSEDEHLGVLLTWLEPPEDEALEEALRQVERLPMGVKTDPRFDADVLRPRIDAYHRACRQDSPHADTHAEAIGRVLKPICGQIYDGIQRAHDLLQALDRPPLDDLEEIEAFEEREFESFMRGRDLGMGIRRRDTPKQAVFGITTRERAMENMEASVLSADQFAQAGAWLRGHLIRGQVVAPRVERHPQYPRRKLYRFELHSDQDPLRVRPGDELSAVLDGRLGAIVEGIGRRGAHSILRLRLSRGMRTPGLPEAGHELALSPSRANWRSFGYERSKISARLASPSWTHQLHGDLPRREQRLGMPDDLLSALEKLR